MVRRNGVAACAALCILRAAAQQFVMYASGDNSVERIDPVLAPGSIGQHVHEVFGSNALAPDVNHESLLQSTCTTVGDAHNNGNSADHSLYWHPALYMEAANGTGYVKVPMDGHKLYYKDAGDPSDQKADPFEFPTDFRMIAGNAWRRSPPANVQQQNITQWMCHDTSGTNQGTYGGFPNGVTDCAATDGFNGAIHFPHCWNGESFNIATPTAHVIYPDGDIENGKCPQSHPTRLPHIFVENTFNLHKIKTEVKPDTFTLAHGDPTGLGWHFDFINGWEAGAISRILKSCPPEKYGNEDVGKCTAFKPAATPVDKCTLPSFYPEKVWAPGNKLPGCNPIQTADPAVIYAVAPLGTYSTDCTPATGNHTSSGSGSGSGSAADSSSSPSPSAASSSAAPSSVAAANSARVPSSTASHSTTLTTAISSMSIVSRPPSYAEKVANAEVTSVDWDVVYVTEVVTVTAGPPTKRDLVHKRMHLHHHAH